MEDHCPNGILWWVWLLEKRPGFLEPCRIVGPGLVVDPRASSPCLFCFAASFQFVYSSTSRASKLVCEGSTELWWLAG